LDGIRKGNEAWIVEDNPPRLNSEELNEFRSELATLGIQCSDGNVNLSSTLVKSRSIEHMCLLMLASNLIFFSDLVLNLDEAEADAMEEGEVMAPEHENALDDLDMMLGEDPETSAHNDLP
jgi:hypothetical protein